MLNIKLQSKFVKTFQGNSFKTLFKKKFLLVKRLSHIFEFIILFLGHTLTRFISHCADNFLSSEHKEIRMEAVRTCSCLLTPTLHVRLQTTIMIINV